MLTDSQSMRIFALFSTISWRHHGYMAISWQMHQPLQTQSSAAAPGVTHPLEPLFTECFCAHVHSGRVDRPALADTALPPGLFSLLMSPESLLLRQVVGVTTGANATNNPPFCK